LKTVEIGDLGLVVALDIYAGILPTLRKRCDKTRLIVFVFDDTAAFRSAWSDYRANRIQVSAQQFMALYRGLMVRVRGLQGEATVSATADMLHGIEGRAEQQQ
jgi:hypothetical protein